jgi:hypothetical protein
MVDERFPADDLRRHYLAKNGGVPRPPTQRDIVCKYRTQIVGLIRDDGATVPDVIAAIIAAGDPVRPPGFEKALRLELGTVRAIRTLADEAARPQPAHEVVSVAPVTPPDLADDFDVEFAARRRRT